MQSEKLEKLMYESGMTAQGCWDHLDEYDKTAILKLAELIVQECAKSCGSQTDKANILKAFGLPVETNVKYISPESSGSVDSQYRRKYNLAPT
jgi:hypothetical protein